MCDFSCNEHLACMGSRRCARLDLFEYFNYEVLIICVIDKLDTQYDNKTNSLTLYKII